MAQKTITPAVAVRGEVVIPGDKSISHRALIIAAMADGDSRIYGLSPAVDVRRTRQCLHDLGVVIEDEGDHVLVRGRGKNGFQQPDKTLDAGNSGTTMRLLAGLLAAQPFTTTITGDASLLNRPMRRIIEPLEMMGAHIDSRENKAPLTIHGGDLRSIDYASSVASAQVKSCVLLAGLYARGTTRMTEPFASRDHTERMLEAFGVSAKCSGSCSAVMGPAQFNGRDLNIPGDISSAAFFMIAACLVSQSDLLLKQIGCNPTRLGIYDALAAMGAHLQLGEVREFDKEPRADIRVKSGRLRGATFAGSMIPRIIDEVPILAIAATQAHGTTIFRDIAELRVKESDRITAIVTNLQLMGANIKEDKDSILITGPTPLHGAALDAFGDHRIAMAFSVAALIADGKSIIKGSECVEVSFPNFYRLLKEVRHAG